MFHSHIYGLIKVAARFKRRHRNFQLAQNYHLQYCINEHSSLSESGILHYFLEIQATAKKLKESQATVVAFLDGTS